MSQLLRCLRGLSTLCIALTSPRTISGLGGRVNSLMFGGTVPVLDVSCSVKSNNMVVVVGFFRS